MKFLPGVFADGLCKMSFLQAVFLTSGFVTSKLFLDFILFITLGYVIWNIVKPIHERYKLVQYLEEAAGRTKKHWLFGHNKEFTTSQEGLLNRCKVLSTNPTMLNHWFGPLITALTLHHPDVAIPLLSSGAPKAELAYGFLRPWIGDGLVTSKGKKWQRNRHLLTPVFHFSILKNYAKVVDESTKIMLDKWEEQTDRSFDVFVDVNLMALDTILRCAMSSHTDCQLKREKHPYIKAVREIAQIYNKRMETPYLFPDFIFWRTSVGKQFRSALDVVHSHAEQVIAERRKALQNAEPNLVASDLDDEESIYKRKRKLDFLDILLQTKDEDGIGLTDSEIKDEVNTFLLAGHDTTASAISWAMYNLSKHPDMQEKCRDEVKEVLGERQSIEWNDLPKFEYLTMFIKESMRLYTPVNGTGRTLDEPITLRSKLNKNYETVIPKGTNCFLFIFAQHRNELIWDKPLEFNPERFTKENIAKRSPHAFIPFSAGSRNCIGQNFAMNEIKIVLTQTLQRYRLYLDEETPEPIMHSLLTLQSKDGIHIKIERLL